MFKAIWPRVIVFVCTFGAVVACIALMPTTSMYWKALNLRFLKDERYQLQTLFLPDLARDIPLLIIGDSLFVQDVQEELQQDSADSGMVINSYDSDDLGLVIRGLRVGARYTNTRSCSLVVQISPTFVLRKKATGPRQNYALLRQVYTAKTIRQRIHSFFGTIDHWSHTNITMPAVGSPPQRPIRMVGQARFASESSENWDRAFADVEKYEGNIVAILDPRGTEWGSGSDLLTETRKALDLLSAKHENFKWFEINKLQSLGLSGCDS